MSRSISSALPVPDPGPRRRGRLKALAILLVCAAPTLAAYLAYYVWPPQGRVNYGELIEPRQVPATALAGVDGKPFSLADLKGKWVLLQVDDGACREACEAKLFNMRQSRLAQGREMERMERVWLLSDEAPPGEQVARLTEGMRIARASGSPVLQAFPAEASVKDHIYLIDPLGNLMLRYPKDADPRKMIKDLARLLKVSRIG